MVKALLIGCGNIGAMYDWDNEQILSHAKAFSKFDEINVDYFDLNKQQASMVADRYNGNLVFDVDKAIQNEFYDIISICTPTPTHYKFLYKALNIKTPVIICEKPISTNKNEINELINLYSVSESKVLINYFRRFQPSFVKVQDIITDLQKSDELTNVSIRYQRGFINNCSHALDLLQFLFQEEFIPTNFIINRKYFDHFDYDPTITACCDWMNANISILGLYNVNYSNFEIDLYFNKTKILIQNSGNDILFFGMENLNIGFSKIETQSQNSMSKCIENYMLPVAEKALNLLKNNWEDNFNESILLNKTILNILNK